MQLWTEIRRSKSFQNIMGLGMRCKSRALLIGHGEVYLIWSSTYLMVFRCAPR